MLLLRCFDPRSPLLTGIEARHVLGHLLHAGEVEEELASGAVVEDEEELLIRLERVVKVDDKGVIDGA